MAVFPYIAGQRLTAAMLNALVPKYIRQSADQTLNTVTLANHNAWANISIGPNESWEFSFNAVIGDSNASSDLKTDLDVTGTVTTDYRHIISMGVTATASNDVTVNVQARTTTTDVSHGVTASASVFATVQEKCLVHGGVSGGTVTYRWACVAASGNVSMKAGGHMIAHRVA